MFENEIKGREACELIVEARTLPEKDEIIILPSGVILIDINSPIYNSVDSDIKSDIIYCG